MQQERATKRQKELLDFIDTFVRENGYGPSYREIMRARNYKSVSTVAVHVDGLIAKGFLLRKDNSPRSLVVTGSNQQTTQAAGNDLRVLLQAHVARYQLDQPALNRLEEALKSIDLADAVPNAHKKDDSNET